MFSAREGVYMWAHVLCADGYTPLTAASLLFAYGYAVRSRIELGSGGGVIQIHRRPINNKQEAICRRRNYFSSFAPLSCWQIPFGRSQGCFINSTSSTVVYYPVTSLFPRTNHIHPIFQQ